MRKHLAYEVHYLVLSACRFPEIDGREAGIYQESALLHARNLLEFTKPATRPTHSDTWWIPDVGGHTPTAEDSHREWIEFINAKVSHLGNRRETDIDWPDPEVHTRLIDLAGYGLKRIKRLLPKGINDMRVKVVWALADLGLSYLDTREQSTLAQIADALDNPLPIQMT